MLCCLCIKEMDINYGTFVDGQQLYNSEGKHSDVYEITWKYFEEQLRYMELSTESANSLAKMICNNFWQCISQFHGFQQTVISAHADFVQNFKRSVSFETEQERNEPSKCPAFIKLEMEMEETATEQAPFLASAEQLLSEADPVKIELQPDVLQIVEHEDSASDDDKPLACRMQKMKAPKRSSGRPKRSRKQTKSKGKTRTVIEKNGDDEVEEDEISDSETEAATCLTADAVPSEAARKKREQDAFILDHWRQQMQCGECAEPCENFAAVRAHFRATHNSSKGYVICCQRKYFHRFHLVDHLQLHLNPEYFKCSECGKCHGNRRSLRVHVKTAHLQPQPQERRFECDICHKRFAKAAILKGHMDIHAEGNKDYVCNVCGKGFVLKHRLVIHQRNVHNTTGGGVCDQCGKAFRGRYALKRHLLEHAGVSKQKWPCDQCGAQLHSKFSLGRHMRLAHHDGTTVYRCGECGKMALTEDALRSHKKYMHEKERKFKCNICDKAFKVAVVLKEHLTTHTGEDLYKCPHCPKMFKVCANMHHHRKRVHPKEWAETRQHRTLASHTDLSAASNEVVM